MSRLQMPSMRFQRPSADEAFRLAAQRRSALGSGVTGSLQALVALAVIPSTLRNPFETAERIVGFIGMILIKAGVHSRFARRFVGVFW